MSRCCRLDLCLNFSPKFYDAADTSANTGNTTPQLHSANDNNKSDHEHDFDADGTSNNTRANTSWGLLRSIHTEFQLLRLYWLWVHLCWQLLCI